jgi:transcriptional regulator with XRE-family HTH domain
MVPDSAATTTFGTRLAALRRERGLTQEELGRGLAPEGGDLGKAAVSAWETGRNQPNATQLRAICQRLNCSANDLLDLQLPWDGQERRCGAQT